MKSIIAYGIVLLLFGGKIVAQQTPAPDQKKPIVLIGGTAHIGNGEVIKNSIIGFEKGKIYIIGDASSIQINNKEAEVINIQGKQVYPGLIAPNTHIGLAEFTVKCFLFIIKVNLLPPYKSKFYVGGSHIKQITRRND